MEEGRTGVPPTPRFGPEVSATLKRALQYYLEYESEFVRVFFPRVAERNYVSLADIAEMTHRQADALRPMLADSVRYFRRQDRKVPSREDTASRAPATDSLENPDLARKERLWTDALRQLCESFGLVDPLRDDG